MKILKRILIVIAIIIAIPLLVALFVKKEFSVSREITINKPSSEVFDYIKYLKNQNNYSEWSQMDPNMKKEFLGTDGTVGAVYAWESEKAGTGEMEITGLTEGKSINLALRFKKPFESNANAPFTVESINENQTKVIWALNGESPYPFNFMNLFCGTTVGDPIERSLAMLKTTLEK